MADWVRDIASGWLALIVDPDVAHRTFLSDALEGEGYRVATCATGAEALCIARDEPPQLAMLEVDTGDVCGYEVCRALQHAFGHAIAIMFVSGERQSPPDRVAGLLLGADDFIAKPVTSDEFLARVRVLTRRLQRAPGASATRAEFGLTAREMEVLQFLADGANQTEIARRLFIAPKTVGKHIEHILGKLSAHSRAEVVSIAHRRGLAPSHSSRARIGWPRGASTTVAPDS